MPQQATHDDHRNRPLSGVEYGGHEYRNLRRLTGTVIKPSTHHAYFEMVATVLTCYLAFTVIRNHKR